jgi:GT2 family glycosyltransferase
MHHSATSLVAELFRRAGVFMGERLIPPDAFKPRGYFEDTEFVTLSREMLAAACPQGDEGWPDWGWTTQEHLREEIWTRYEGRGRQLADARNASHPLWGWKDPRASLLLDFWLRILPNAKFIFVCREPWAVAAGLTKLGIPAFTEHPDYAFRAWAFYNRRLLDFHRAHPGQSVFLPVAQLNKAPHKILDRITSHFGFAFISHDRAESMDVVRAWNPGAMPNEKAAEKQFASEHPAFAQLWREIQDAASSQWSAPIAPLPAPAPVPAAPPPPRVSIVIPCFNDGAYIDEAIASAEASEGGLHEIVVVNDGSTDPRTIEVLQGLPGRGIAVVNQENKGVAEAINAGIRASLGEYILPLSADNRIHPSYVANSVAILDTQPDVGVAYGDSEWFGDRQGPRPSRPFDFYALHLGNYIDTCAMFRRKVWDDAGGFDPALRLGYEDWDFWLSAAEKGWKFHHLQDVLFYYRMRPEALSSTMAQPDNHRATVRYIVAKHPSFAEIHADVIADLSAMLIRPPPELADDGALRRISADLEQARAELAGAVGELNRTRRTRSWRVTAPLRALHRLLQVSRPAPSHGGG